MQNLRVIRVRRTPAEQRYLSELIIPTQLIQLKMV